MEMQNEKARRSILNKLFLSSDQKEVADIDKKEKDEKKYADLFNYTADELELNFAKEFNKLHGNFVYAENEERAFIQLKQMAEELNWQKIYCRENLIIQKLNYYNLGSFISSDLVQAQVSITTCDFLVARTGSIAVSSLGVGDRLSSVFAPIHICIAYNYQVVPDISDVLNFYKKKQQHKELTERPSFFSLITGPSKTADIEKTLVKGVHGPEDVFVFFIDT